MHLSHTVDGVAALTLARYESGNGVNHRNFELVRSNATGGLTWVYRSGDNPQAWHLVKPMLAVDDKNVSLPGQNAVGQPVLTGSSFNRDFEVVFVNTGGFLSSWHYSQSWNDWFYLGQSPFGGLQGNPGYTQMDDSSFSLVVRTTSGSLQEVCSSAPFSPRA